MPQYAVEQYELHVVKYLVEAEDEAAAIKKVLDGGCPPVDNSQEFVELATEYGMNAEENSDIAEKLHEHHPCKYLIPSIRSVEEV